MYFCILQVLGIWVIHHFPLFLTFLFMSSGTQVHKLLLGIYLEVKFLGHRADSAVTAKFFSK